MNVALTNSLRNACKGRMANYATTSFRGPSAQTFSSVSLSNQTQPATKKVAEAEAVPELHELPLFQGALGSKSAFLAFRAQQKKLMFDNGVTNHGTVGVGKSNKPEFFRRRGVLGKSGSGRKNTVHYSW